MAGLSGLPAGVQGLADGAADPAFAVVVHPSNQFDSLSRAKVNFLFKPKVSRWPWGAQAEPVDLPEHSAARLWLAGTMLRTSQDSLTEYWIEERTSRGAAPPQVADASATRRLVSGHRGGIGYVSFFEVGSTAKVLRVE